jgi:hypothetical protein
VISAPGLHSLVPANQAFTAAPGDDCARCAESLRNVVPFVIDEPPLSLSRDPQFGGDDKMKQRTGDADEVVPCVLVWDFLGEPAGVYVPNRIAGVSQPLGPRLNICKQRIDGLVVGFVNEGASATTPTTAPFTAQTAATVHRAVVPHRHWR